MDVCGAPSMAGAYSVIQRPKLEPHDRGIKRSEGLAAHSKRAQPGIESNYCGGISTDPLKGQLP